MAVSPADRRTSMKTNLTDAFRRTVRLLRRGVHRDGDNQAMDRPDYIRCLVGQRESGHKSCGTNRHTNRISRHLSGG